MDLDATIGCSAANLGDFRLMKWSGIQYRRWLFIKTWRSGSLRLLYYLFLILGLLSLALVLANTLFNSVLQLPAVLIGLSLIFLSPFLLFVGVDLYAGYLQHNPKYAISPESIKQNPLNGVDYDSLFLLNLLRTSKSWVSFWQKAQYHGQVGEIIFRLGLTPDALSKVYKTEPPKDTDQSVLTGAAKLASDRLVSQFDILSALIAFPDVVEFFKEENLKDTDVAKLLEYYQARQAALEQVSHSEKTGGFAKSWAVSYTNLLDEVASPISPQVRFNTLLTPIYSRQSLITNIANELLKNTGGNILLTGEAGIGKTEIFYHFASDVLNYKTKTELDGYDVRVLDVERLLTMGDSEQELRRVIGQLFSELVRAGNVILFINRINLLLSPNSETGTANLGNLLEGYLQTPRVKIVGTMPQELFLELVKPNALLSKDFAVIEVPAPSTQDMVGIVLNHVDTLEYRYKCFFGLSAVNDLIALAGRYLKNDASPMREITLAEEVAVETHARNQRMVTEEVVNAVIEKISKVPIQVKEEERDTLMNLEGELHKRIIGQNTAIKEISDALLRARAGMTSGARPIGSFLFLGPTGVGKTETAKALAATYFGSEKKMVRLDMSEYADDSALTKLLGTNQTNDPGALTIAIQENPSTVVLFDEIEKANTLTRNTLLQLLDEGRLTTNYGKVLDFTNTIVIATSNAGSDFIRTQIEQGIDVKAFEKQLIDRLIAQKIYLPEFLNRFDGVIVYTPLSRDEIKQVVLLQVAMLEKKIQAEKGITLKLSDAVIADLATHGYDPVFGARALRRVMEGDLETAIAKQIIAQNPQPGTTLSIESLN